MSRADRFTNTEHDAGLYERATTEPVDEREHDEPGPPLVRGHACTDPACRELLCVLDRVVAEGKAGRR